MSISTIEMGTFSSQKDIQPFVPVPERSTRPAAADEWFAAFVRGIAMWPGNDGIAQREPIYLMGLLAAPPTDLDTFYNARPTSEQFQHAYNVMMGQHARMRGGSTHKVDGNFEVAKDGLDHMYRGAFISKATQILQGIPEITPEIEQSAKVAESVAKSELGKTLSHMFIAQRDNLQTPWSDIYRAYQSDVQYAPLLDIAAVNPYSSVPLKIGPERRAYTDSDSGVTAAGLLFKASVNAAIEQADLPNPFTKAFQSARFAQPESALSVPIIRMAIDRAVPQSRGGYK